MMNICIYFKIKVENKNVFERQLTINRAKPPLDISCKVTLKGYKKQKIKNFSPKVVFF